MKRFSRVFLLACLSLALLTVTALADMGPKSKLTVKVKNAPQELYYLDLLAEGDDFSYPSLTEEELAALDQDLSTRFAGKAVRVFAAYSGEASVGENWKAQMEEHYGEKFVRIDPLALNICCHTGPGAIALGCAEYEA